MREKITIKHIFIAFVFAFLGIILVTFAIHINPDNDMWWMMATGRYIVENKELPATNVFVIHEGFDLIVQQWVLAVVNYLLYHVAGKWGLIVFVLVAFVFNMTLLYRLAGHYTKKVSVKLAVLFLGMVLCRDFLNTRPALVTMGILLIEQIVILNWKESKKKKWLWAIPLLSIAEMNIQAALWPMLFVMTLPHIVPDFLNRGTSIREQIKEKKDFIIPLIASFFVGFINPRMEEGVFYLVNSYDNSTIVKLIGEMKSPNTASFDGITIILAFALLALYLYKNWDWQKGCFMGDISKVYMLTGVGILAAMHVRNMWILLLGIVPVICDIFSQDNVAVFDGTFLKLHSKKKRGKAKTIELLLLGIELGLVLVIEAFVLSKIPIDTNVTAYVDAAEYLDSLDNKEEIVLYTTFNSGGYMEWRGYKVYIDARAEAFQKKVNGVADIADEYYEVIKGTADYAAFLEKYDFTHIFTEKDDYFDLYLETSGVYDAVVVNEKYVLYEK